MCGGYYFIFSDLLSSSVSVLHQNADHFCGIIYMFHEAQDDGINSNIKALYDYVAKRFMPFLLPISNSNNVLLQKTRDKKSYVTPNLYDSTHNPTPVFTYLCRIKADTNYIVSTSEHLGELCVWELSTQTVVRRMVGLKSPKAVRMIDNTSAVVLCGRKLKLYNIDQGVLISSLKGVLHINLSYFEIHDSNHVIVLSRDRMSVNMINNSSGDLVASFKLGENRFLKSYR